MKKVTTTQMPYVGMDVGYGYTKLHRDAGSLSIPSAVAPWTDFKFASLSFNKDEIELFGIELNGQRWMIGDLAVRQSREFVHVMDREKFRSEETRITAIGGIALLMFISATEGGKKNVEGLTNSAPVVVGTGLPVNYYNEKNITELKKLIGDYDVKLVFPYARKLANEVSMKFKIADVVVVVQPYGTYYYLKKQNLLEPGFQAYGIVDIGFGTTDFIVVENDVVNETLSGSVDVAMTTVLQETVRLAELDIDTTSLEFKYIQQQLDSGFSKLEITHGGKRIDIKPYYEEAAKRVAARLASEVIKVWRNDVPETVYFTGGGAKALFSYLTAQEQFSFSHLVEIAEYANVRGFYYVARDGIVVNR